MLRKIALLAGMAAVLYGCAGPADPPPAAAPASSQAPAGTAPVQVSPAVQVSPTVAVDFPADEPPPDLTISTADACRTVDVFYQNLDAETRTRIGKGLRAEAAGDTKTVRKILLSLRPLFSSNSATMLDSAGKVRDPEMKAALTRLAEISAKEASFTTFAEFRSLAPLLAPVEATLKTECAAAGYPLANVT